MPRLMTSLMLGSALILTAACAKKAPEELPPPPPTKTTPPAAVVTETPQPQPTTPTNIPGSRADFVATAGTDTVLFATDSADLDAEATATLAKHAQWLQQNPAVRVTVEGHCDERGTREYNLALGDRRANAAKNYLVSNGVPADRISVISYGKERPVAQGSDEAAWAQNRRAVTVVLQ